MQIFQMLVVIAAMRQTVQTTKQTAAYNPSSTDADINPRFVFATLMCVETEKDYLSN
jgi:hypothetical protein